MANHDTIFGRDLHRPSRQPIINDRASELTVGQFVKLDVLDVDVTIDEVTRPYKRVTTLAVAEDIIVGYVDRNIAPGNDGSVLTLGSILMNTAGINEGTELGLALDGGVAVLSAAAANKIARVTVGDAASGEILFNSLSIATGSTGGATTLPDLTDVANTTTSSAVDGQVLTFDDTLGASGEWVNQASQSGGATTLPGLNDVDAATTTNARASGAPQILTLGVNGGNSTADWVNNVAPGVSTSSQATGESLVAGTDGFNHSLKGLEVSGSLTISNTTNDVVINSDNQNNTTSNLVSPDTASSFGLAAPKVNSNLPFKAITEGTNMSFTANTNDVVINTTAEINTASNQLADTTTSKGLATTKDGVDLKFKNITAGNNISITEDANQVTIAATSGGGGATALPGLSDVSNTVTTTAVNKEVLTFDGTEWTNQINPADPPTDSVAATFSKAVHNWPANQAVADGGTLDTNAVSLFLSNITTQPDGSLISIVSNGVTLTGNATVDQPLITSGGTTFTFVTTSVAPTLGFSIQATVTRNSIVEVVGESNEVISVSAGTTHFVNLAQFGQIVVGDYQQGEIPTYRIRMTNLSGAGLTTSTAPGGWALTSQVDTYDAFDKSSVAFRQLADADFNVIDGNDLMRFNNAADQVNTVGLIGEGIISVTHDVNDIRIGNNSFDLNTVSDVSISNPVNTQQLTYNGTNWANANDNSAIINGSISATLGKVNQEFTFGNALGFGVGNASATVPYTGTSASGTPNGLIEFASGTNNLTVLEDAQVTIPILQTDTLFHVALTESVAAGDLRFSLELLAIRSSGNAIISVTPEVACFIGGAGATIPLARITDFPSTMTGDFIAGDVVGIRVRVRNSSLVSRTLVSSGNVGGWGNITSEAGTVTAIRRTSIDLNEINNVTVPSPSTGDRLSFDGTNWINDARADAFFQANTTSADISNTRSGINVGTYVSAVAIDFDPTGNWSTPSQPGGGTRYTTGKTGVFEFTFECEIYGSRNPPASTTVDIIGFVDTSEGNQSRVQTTIGSDTITGFVDTSEGNQTRTTTSLTIPAKDNFVTPTARIIRRNPNGELYPDGRDNFLNTVLRIPDVRDVTSSIFSYTAGATYVKVSGVFFMHENDGITFEVEDSGSAEAVSVRRIVGEVTELS